MKKLHNYYIKEAKRKKGGRREDKKKTWRRPTLPQTNCSTIGEEAFHGRVRDGNGCFRFSMVTRKIIISHTGCNAEMRCFRIETIIWSSLTAY